MRKKLFVCCAVLLLLAPLPGLMKARDAWRIENADTWVQENIAFRKELIGCHDFLCRLFFHESGNTQVILGKSGTLFYADTTDNFIGVNRMKPSEILEIADYLATIDASLKAKGSRLIFLCAPNKNSVLSDEMPYYALQSALPSNREMLHEALQSTKVTVVDVYPLLKEEKEPYLKTDTHWSDRGALLVYRALMEAMHTEEYDAYADAMWQESAIEGDLAVLCLPDAKDSEITQKITFQGRFQTQGIFRTTMDMNIHTVSERNSLSVFMLRDSFGSALFPFLAENIGTLHMTRSFPYSETMLGENIPNAVIWEIAERNLPTLLNAAQGQK